MAEGRSAGRWAPAPRNRRLPARWGGVALPLEISISTNVLDEWFENVVSNMLSLKQKKNEPKKKKKRNCYSMVRATGGLTHVNLRGQRAPGLRGALRSIVAFLISAYLKDVGLSRAPDGFIVQGLVLSGASAGTWVLFNCGRSLKILSPLNGGPQ